MDAIRRYWIDDCPWDFQFHLQLLCFLGGWQSGDEYASSLIQPYDGDAGFIFDQQSTGTLLSRITYDSEQVASSSSDALITVVREGASIIALFCMMFYYSWQLSLILIVIAPVVSIAIRMVSKRFRNISKNMQNTMGTLTTSAEQMLKGHKEVLIFGGQKVESKRFDKTSNWMRQQNMKMVAASSVSDPVIQLIASFALAFVLYAASVPSVMETLTAGTITVVFSSMIALMRPLKSLTNVNAKFQRGMAACQTLFAILDLEQEKDTGKLEVERAKGDVEFRNVTFSYNGKGAPALKNVSFKIPANKTVALVGRSGSGKSTIANLLTRFYDIQEGEILLDGHDLREYTLSSLRNQVGLVSQNVHLFNDTIANNIAYARNEVYSREQIEEAARMAYAMDFIEKMENGLDTVIGENGVLLSGGNVNVLLLLVRYCVTARYSSLMKRPLHWIRNPNAQFSLRWMSCRRTVLHW